jgi:hypothetical protein
MHDALGKLRRFQSSDDEWSDRKLTNAPRRIGAGPRAVRRTKFAQMHWLGRSREHRSASEDREAWTWSGFECQKPLASAGSVQRIAISIERRDHAAAPVVNHERPFAAHANVQIAMRLEESGQAPHRLDDEIVAETSGCRNWRVAELHNSQVVDTLRRPTTAALVPASNS